MSSTFSPPDAPLATLHLWGVSGPGVARALLRMGADRPALRATPGLRFAKLLGTGSGQTFSPRDADLRRWGLFAVWDGPAALSAFERTSGVARAWAALADERWRVQLAVLRSHGRWSGREPFAGALRHAHGAGGPVAALTRARIRWTAQRTFWRAVPAVSADLRDQPGLRFAVGIGDAPTGLQGTFSVWDDAAALARFAYGGAAHRAAIQRTAETGWYAEELFTRFSVLASEGTVCGRDPAVRASQRAASGGG